MSALKPDCLLIHTRLNDLLKSVKCSSSADEQNVRRIDLDQFLLRMLSASLRRRYRCNRSLKDLKQRLLYTLAGYISRDRHVLGLLGDLIDLIDIDDTVLCTLNVVICRLNNLSRGYSLHPSPT